MRPEDPAWFAPQASPEERFQSFSDLAKRAQCFGKTLPDTRKHVDSEVRNLLLGGDTLAIAQQARVEKALNRIESLLTLALAPQLRDARRFKYEQRSQILAAYQDAITRLEERLGPCPKWGRRYLSQLYIPHANAALEPDDGGPLEPGEAARIHISCYSSDKALLRSLLPRWPRPSKGLTEAKAWLSRKMRRKP